MKKIVALVLSLVMALSLCTVAFADVSKWTTNESYDFDTYDEYNQKTGENYKLTFHAAKAPTSTELGNIAYWEDGTTCYTMSNTYVKDFDKVVKVHNADVKVGEQNKKDPSYFLTAVDAVSYKYTGSLFTGWGTKCGQYAEPDDADVVDYLTFTMDDETVVYPALETANEAYGNWGVLVDGVVYTAAAPKQTTIAHNWVASAYDKKTGEATEYTCNICKTKAVVLADAYDPAGNGKTVEKLNDGTLIAFTYTPGQTTPAKDGVNSAKTFDAGVAMYVGMSLLSVAGGAVVIGKKKEF